MKQKLNFLTPQQVIFFHQQGYLVLENFFSPLTCEMLGIEAAQLVNQCDLDHLFSIYHARLENFSWEGHFLKANKKMCYFFEEEMFQAKSPYETDKYRYIQKISYALHLLNPVFQQFSYEEKIKGVLKDLSMEDFLITQSMYLYKQPGFNQIVPWHQDSSFVHSEPDSLIGLWFACEDAYIDNGCLWVIPKEPHHRLKFKALKQPNGHLDYEVYDEHPWEEEKKVPLEVPKGTLILMHGHTPHMSGPNQTKTTRQAFTMHVINQQSVYLTSNVLF